MTTLKDKIRDVVEEYHRSLEELSSDPQALLEGIMDEIKDYFEKITN